MVSPLTTAKDAAQYSFTSRYGGGKLTLTDFDGSRPNHVALSTGGFPAGEFCRVLAEDSELGDAVSSAQRAVAIEHCLAPVITVPCGRWDPQRTTIAPEGIGLLVLRGLLIRRVGVGDRSGTELLGQGDLLRPWQGADPPSKISHPIGWQILDQTRLAVLDQQAAARFAMYPELMGRLVNKALRRSRNLTSSLAIAQHTLVNERLTMLFWHLADRWGRAHPNGVLVPLRLTHSIVAELVGARRPSVSTAISQLRRQGIVHRVREGWLLRGKPPTQLLRLTETSAAALQHQTIQR